MNDKEIREKLLRIVQEAGTLRKAGEWLNLDHAFLWRVIKGKKRPGTKLLNALGMRESGRAYELKGYAHERTEPSSQESSQKTGGRDLCALPRQGT